MKYLVIIFISLLVFAHVHAQSVTVSQLPSGTICSGTSVEFMANPSGFPGQIFYQWYLNGTAIPGATSANYTTSTLNNGDQIFVQCSNSTVDDMVPGSEFYYDATNPNSYRGGSATVYDLSGNNRHGTVQNFIAQGNPNASWSPTDGGVFNFNGTNQSITTGWTPSNTMSFQIAFRSLEEYGRNWNRGLLSTFGTSGNTTIDFNGFYIGTQHYYQVPYNPMAPSNGLHYYYDGNGYGEIGTENQTFNSTSTWYVLTVVSNPADNGGNGSIKFYLNGSATPLANTGNNNKQKTAHAGDIVIGRSRFNTDYWLGYIANVIVYDRVLSIQEIASNYRATISRVSGASSASVISTVTNSIVLSSAKGTNNQSICNNAAITAIKYATTGATGANITGLPQGVTGEWNNNVVTISGTPVPTSGNFTYTVTLTGGCGTVTRTGQITISSGTISSVAITLTGDGLVGSSTLSTPAGLNSYAWFLNGSEIAGQNTRTHIPTVDGNYFVRVFNGNCYGTSSDVTIYSVPTVALALNGDECTNKTTLSANKTFNSYAWFLNGSEISNSNSQTYKPTAAGNYYVRVFNGSSYGNSSAVTINVCGISQTGQMSPTTTSLINTIGGAANTDNKGMDQRGSILNVPN